jgi:hypothetical protein
VTPTPHPCEGPALDLARRFTGVWEEYTVDDNGETLEGRLETSLDLGGCVLMQRFTSADGGFAFVSFGYVTPETGNWFETYVFDTGRSSQWRWYDNGDEVTMDHVDGTGAVTRRLRVVEMTDDAYDVIEEKRDTATEPWEFVVLTRTRRVAE